MKPEEKIVEQFLKKNWDTVIFEPDGNITPDFLVDSKYAIEVRRLNENFFEVDKSQGLEQLAYPLYDAFYEVLRSFDGNGSEKTYWVAIEFHRPIIKKINPLKSEMKLALQKFLKIPSELPYQLEVNDTISFYLYESEPKAGRLFRPAGGVDDDGGGSVISLYVNNIQYCISDKTVKIKPHLPKYAEWWLVLVDNMDWWLDNEEINEIVSAINELGNFDEIKVIRMDGEKQLLNISKLALDTSFL